MRKTLLAIVVTLSTCASAEGAWEFRDYVTPLGDKGTGIFQTDADGVGATFFFACDRDRWRAAGLLPTPGKPLRMDARGKIRFSFTEGFGPAGVWRTSRLPNDLVGYEMPQPTEFVGKMLAEERKNPDATIRFELLDANGKRARLVYSLRGLADAIRTHLWEPCKLDVYFADPEREEAEAKD